jgi:hypothetical protein
MAIKIDGMKKKAKSKEIVADEKYTGAEPTWDTERAEKFTQDEYDHYLRVSLRYYNYYYTTKDLKKYLVDWLRKTADSEVHQFDKSTIDYYAKTKDSVTSFTACAIAKAYTKGMPLRKNITEYLIETVNKAISLHEQSGDDIDAGAKAKVSKTAVKVPTIQDRMNEIALQHRFYFEGLEDELHSGATVHPKAYEYLISNNVPQAMLGKILSFFEGHHKEVSEARTTKDEDLKDAYAHLKAADYKRYDAFYTQLFEGFAQYAQVKKATKKAAVRKPPQKEKLVAKLKYMKNDTVNKLVSISPVDIIGAQELWVYNTKTRKLGKYVAEDMGGALGVKGTAITGFDLSKSVQKTLRKPEVQLKEFMAAGKIQLRKFLDDIKATDIKLNGRINPDTILLKVQ